MGYRTLRDCINDLQRTGQLARIDVPQRDREKIIEDILAPPRPLASLPVQVSSAGMDTAALKAEFGERICFWGAIDTQRVLPQGSADEVRAEVRQRIADLAPGGGYVLAPVHNIQEDVSPENILAMADAALEYGGLGTDAC